MDEQLSLDSSSGALELAAGFPVAQVRLKPRKSRPFFGRHPWVLDSAIASVDGDPRDGDLVDLLSEKGKFLARGTYNSQSRIRVRLYSWDATVAIDDQFWRKRLTAAVEWRRHLGLLQPETACRLVFSEADYLSGLIVDRYGDYLAIQVTALAMAQRLPTLVPMLVELLAPRGILVRNERGIGKVEGLEVAEGLYWGEAPEGPIFIAEHGIRYGVDLTTGQKTGFYVDQRDNRRVAAGYFAGRRVLDMFCYNGGFGLNAAVHGAAREVLCVDSSQRALTLAAANAQLNGVANIQFRQGDGFNVLDDLLASGEKFGGIVLDPPKFARSRGSVNDALQAYHRINRAACGLLEPGGVLVTCSCSGHVSREDFLWMLSGVAQRSGREIQVIEQRGASADHPVATTCLETEYLKCFICRVL